MDPTWVPTLDAIATAPAEVKESSPIVQRYVAQTSMPETVTSAATAGAVAQELPDDLIGEFKRLGPRKYMSQNLPCPFPEPGWTSIFVKKGQAKVEDTLHKYWGYLSDLVDIEETQMVRLEWERSEYKQAKDRNDEIKRKCEQLINDAETEEELVQMYASDPMLETEAEEYEQNFDTMEAAQSAIENCSTFVQQVKMAIRDIDRRIRDISDNADSETKFSEIMSKLNMQDPQLAKMNEARQKRLAETRKHNKIQQKAREVNDIERDLNRRTKTEHHGSPFLNMLKEQFAEKRKEKEQVPKTKAEPKLSTVPISLDELMRRQTSSLPKSATPIPQVQMKPIM